MEDYDLQTYLSAQGSVIVTPDASRPYKVVFRLNERVLAEYPVNSIQEGEELIREKTGRGKRPGFLESVPDISAPYRPD